jgi:hypothetical protein
MNAYAAQFTQPLNAGLTSAVANNTQGYLAEHGLTDSPAISQQVEAQAIAPYVQQNQQAGYSDALQALGLGGGAVNPNTSSANSIAALAKAFAALPGGLKSLSPTMLQQIQNISAPGIIPQGTPQGAAPGPIDTSGMAGDYSGLFPSTTPDVQPYTPDYISATGGGDPSLGVVGDYGG